ncbi:MAG: mechanosensitive ion channel domain-containing protein, partial [Myxococcota bacterium]
AWIVLATEGQIVRGVWVRTGDIHGAIDSFTLRSVWIVDAYGQRISIPNRILLQQPIQAATDSFPKTHVTIRLADVDAGLARTVLREAALLSPWLAPSTTPLIGQEPSDPSRWQVSVRLLEGAYEDDFAGSFPERVREVLAAYRAPPAFEE